MENCSQTYNGHRKENKITLQQFVILVGFHVVGLKNHDGKKLGEERVYYIL